MVPLSKSVSGCANLCCGVLNKMVICLIVVGRLRLLVGSYALLNSPGHGLFITIALSCLPTKLDRIGF